MVWVNSQTALKVAFMSFIQQRKPITMLPMLGNKLITQQNKSGIICNKLLLVEKVDKLREMYLSILYDRVS